jgi:mono/diheme cytochrome c family protein
MTRLPGQTFALLLALLPLTACGGGDVPLPQIASVSRAEDAQLVVRGEYIVRSVAVCGHCHAADPKSPDGPLVGGFEFKGWRLGTIAAKNLTSDVETGLGSWTDAEIVRALRNGEDKEGEVMAPVMPYEWFHGMADQDALAVARYLKSLSPVRNEVTDNENFVFDMAELILLEPMEAPAPRESPPRAVSVEYGRYLANSVSLCADCHTPRGGIMQAHDRDRLFAGDATPPEGFPANPRNLTPDQETGIGRWTEADFLRALRTGVTPGGRELNPFMPWQQFRRMTDGDLRAIWLYLRSLEPISSRIPIK